MQKYLRHGFAQMATDHPICGDFINSIQSESTNQSRLVPQGTTDNSPALLAPGVDRTI
jgi:hypothetical protein